ncbi:MAG: MarR family winged helix-turn-helix transcriptional regulator [Candidatus Binatia bacterium]
MKDHGPQVHAAIGELQRLTDLFRERRAQLARSVGLTEQQWQVLEEIATEHFMPSMFARARDSSAAAVSRTLRQLLDKGLVAVSVSPDDGRHRRYVLTPRGARTMERLRERRREAIEAIWMALDPAALRTFTHVSREIAGRIEAYAARQTS